MAKIAFLFPGQGSQAVGMGKDLYHHVPAAHQVLDQFATWTDPLLLDIMFNGPEETLKRTLYTQPAILAVSLAAWAAFTSKTNLKPQLAAGHSLGEYGALVAAGVISIETAAKLIQQRATLMENTPTGAMAAILGMSAVDVEAVVTELQQQTPPIGCLAVANYNTPEQIILSGEKAAVEAACHLAKERGALKTILLPVGGAFHSPLMHHAANQFATFLTDFSFADAQFPVITNVDAQITRSGAEFQQKLSQQIDGSVRWSQTIATMCDSGIDTFIEIGPGKILAGMMKKMARHAVVYNIYDSASLAQTLDAVQEKVPS